MCICLEKGSYISTTTGLCFPSQYMSFITVIERNECYAGSLESMLDHGKWQEQHCTFWLNTPTIHHSLKEPKSKPKKK